MKYRLILSFCVALAMWGICFAGAVVASLMGNMGPYDSIEYALGPAVVIGMVDGFF